MAAGFCRIRECPGAGSFARRRGTSCRDFADHRLGSADGFYRGELGRSDRHGPRGSGGADGDHGHQRRRPADAFDAGRAGPADGFDAGGAGPADSFDAGGAGPADSV